MARRQRIILTVGGVLLAAGGVIYFQASRVPRDYTPVTLSPVRREEMRQKAAQRLTEFAALVGQLGSWDPRDIGPDGKPLPDAPRLREGKFQIGQAEINEWAATAGEKFEDGLAEMGMSAPAIAFGENRLTFYSHWDKHGKIIGVDMSPHFTDDGKMTLEIDTTRIGEMPMPEVTLQKHKSEIVRKLQSVAGKVDAADTPPAGGAPDPMRLVAPLVAQIANALEGQPVALDIRQDFGNVRIRGIKLTAGGCTLDLVPLEAPPAAKGLADSGLPTPE